MAINLVRVVAGEVGACCMPMSSVDGPELGQLWLTVPLHGGGIEETSDRAHKCTEQLERCQ